MAQEIEHDFPPQGHIAIEGHYWSDNKFHVLRVDGNDYLIVNAAIVALPTGAATSAKQLPNSHDVTVDNTVTVQSAGGDKVFGIEGIVNDKKQNTNTTASTTKLYSTVVPAGRLHCITNIFLMYDGTAPDYMQATAYIDEVEHFIGRWDGVVSPNCITLQCEIYLPDGDQIIFESSGCTNGDKVYMVILGYQLNEP